MAKKIQEEEILSAYAASEENPQMTESVQTNSPFEGTATIEPSTPTNKMAQAARENRMHGRDLPYTGDGSGLNYRDNIGYLQIPVESLPTSGIFYPAGFEIQIRAARGEEIKHWSTMNDQDINQLSRVDDILNYMIEKCCVVKNPEYPGNCWRDLKNVDRFYILLAIREFTFLDGDNELMVPISEGQEIPVTKEMIDFIDIPEDVMKFFDPTQKCFVFNVNGQTINMHVPSIGVNDWLKKYAAQKINAREGYDEDFLTFAPMLIRDHRGLNQKAYEDMVASSRLWSVKEWSIISYVTEKLSTSTEPKIKYNTDNGEEVEIPLTFRGGLRSLFVLSNPLLTIC